MARRGDADVFQHVVIELAEKLPGDFVLGERLCVLTETESIEPLTDIGHGATLTRCVRLEKPPLAGPAPGCAVDRAPRSTSASN